METSLIVIFILSLFGQAYFSGSETAFVYARYNQSPESVQFWKRRMRSLLAVTLIGTNVSVNISSVLGAAIFHKIVERFGGGPLLAGAISVGFVSTFSLIFCEIMPKSLGLARSISVASFTSPSLVVFFIHFLAACKINRACNNTAF